MGMDLQTHLGPYLEVMGELTETITKVKRQCPNHPKINQSNNKCCPECGTVVINVDFPEVRPVRPSHLLEDDNLLPAHEMPNILLPNGYPPNELEFDTDLNNAIDLSNIDSTMDEQMNWFRQEYADDIKILQDKFGKHNIAIRWGIVSYWS